MWPVVLSRSTVSPPLQRPHALDAVPMLETLRAITPTSALLAVTIQKISSAYVAFRWICYSFIFRAPQPHCPAWSCDLTVSPRGERDIDIGEMSFSSATRGYIAPRP